MQQRQWMELLNEYDFGIEYKQGKYNIVADALSCKSTLASISISHDTLADEIRKGMTYDLYFNKIHTAMENPRKSEKEQHLIDGYHLQEDLFYFRHRLCIPNNKEIKEFI